MCIFSMMFTALMLNLFLFFSDGGELKIKKNKKWLFKRPQQPSSAQFDHLGGIGKLPTQSHVWKTDQPFFIYLP